MSRVVPYDQSVSDTALHLQHRLLEDAHQRQMENAVPTVFSGAGARSRGRGRGRGRGSYRGRSRPTASGGPASASVPNPMEAYNACFLQSVVNTLKEKDGVLENVLNRFDARVARFRRLKQIEIERREREVNEKRSSARRDDVTAEEEADDVTVVDDDDVDETGRVDGTYDDATDDYVQQRGGDPFDNYEYVDYPPRSHEYLNVLREVEQDYGAGRGRGCLGKERLVYLLDRLKIDAIWNERHYSSTFGGLVSALVRLFTAEYEHEYENLVVQMLQVAMENKNCSSDESATNVDGTDRPTSNSSRSARVSSYFEQYKRRSRDLYHFVSYRYVLEILYEIGRVTLKNKEDLIILYLLLTMPEIKILRNGDSDVGREQYVDPITGHDMRPAQLLTRPLFVSMRLENVFGNIGKNVKRLERSLTTASNNLKRRSRVGGGVRASAATREENVAGEVTALLDNATVLDGVRRIGVDEMASLPLSVIDKSEEHETMSNMLEKTLIVSMMAEEYRAYAIGETGNLTATRPSTATNERSRSTDYGDYESVGAGRNPVFNSYNHLPVFYHFTARQGPATSRVTATASE